MLNVSHIYRIKYPPVWSSYKSADWEMDPTDTEVYYSEEQVCIVPGSYIPKQKNYFKIGTVYNA